ncbi:hypothetical protein [Levilactobacillus namurensis]|uniref:hypothetical protein n=1 Tax=Levilactobacillus namurensis TaxID=380393 RepID=UPI001D97A7B7|nr:hypothetical protein [Levilactobacillus namurensis]HJE44111.1 hypothetical protein [Levilactobacillus namurensis]
MSKKANWIRWTIVLVLLTITWALQILDGTEKLSMETVTLAISVIALVVAVIGLVLAIRNLHEARHLFIRNSDC